IPNRRFCQTTTPPVAKKRKHAANQSSQFQVSAVFPVSFSLFTIPVEDAIAADLNSIGKRTAVEDSTSRLSRIGTPFFASTFRSSFLHALSAGNFHRPVTRS